MAKPTVVNLFSNNSEKLTAESQAILEARSHIEAEMQAELSAQERARISAHARLLAQSRANTEMELTAQLKLQCKEEAKLAEIAQHNLEATEVAKREAQEKLAVELSLQAENKARVIAEQQAQAELNNRLEQEKNARAAAEALIKTERELAELLEQEWQAKLDAHAEAEKKLKSLKKEISNLVINTERVSAELNAAEQMQMNYVGKKERLESKLRDLPMFNDGIEPEFPRSSGSKSLVETVEQKFSGALTQERMADNSAISFCSDPNSLPEAEENLIAYHEAELAELLRVAEDRKAANFIAKRKLTENHAEFEGAKYLAHSVGQRKHLAEQGAAELLATQLEAERKAAHLQELTNAMLCKAEMVARERLDREAQANQLAELKLQAELDLTELAAHRAMADSEVIRELELKLQKESQELSIVNNRIFLEQQLRLTIEKNIEIEAASVTQIEARLNAELRAIESGNDRLAQELRTTEIKELAAVLNQQAIQIASELAKATERALNLAKVRVEMEGRALNAEQAKCHAEELATAALQQRIAAAKLAGDEALARTEKIQKILIDKENARIERCKFISDQHEQMENMILQLERQQLIQEQKLVEQFSKCVAAAENKPVSSLLVDSIHKVENATPTQRDAEQNAMHRANEIIETLMRPRHGLDSQIECAADKFAENFSIDQFEQDRIESEHRLLNECWRGASRNRDVSKNRTLN